MEWKLVAGRLVAGDWGLVGGKLKFQPDIFTFLSRIEV
jgi:hypothetical protein